jgi:hypothetical protein
MSNVEVFMNEVVSDMRHRLAQLETDDARGERGPIEDGIAVLTDYRLSDLDESLFERLLATLQAGRSPVRMRVLRPEALGAELSRRWQMFRQGGAVAAHG